MNHSLFAQLQNGEVRALREIPLLPFAQFRSGVLQATKGAGNRVVAFFARPSGAGLEFFAVLGEDSEGLLWAARGTLSEKSFPSFTADCAQFQGFEREIAEQFGVHPKGHPWLKPIRFQNSLSPEAANLYRVEGEEVHEVAVGPVHAGVIEPGHFRFQCHGEKVFHLEISLGYQHRGIERALVGGPGKRTLHYMETLAGDTSVGHAMAYCHAMEGLAGVRVPVRALVIRGVALELERLANHVGDLSALSGDIGFLPTASFCGRIRGDFLNMTAELCGSRFGRGLVRPGGTGFDLPNDRAQILLERLGRAREDLEGAVRLLWETPTVIARFEKTGTLARQECLRMGIVGPAARASGIFRDVRHNFPQGPYRYFHIPVMTAPDGDVYSRAFIRWLEIQKSAEFVEERLRNLPRTPVCVPMKEPAPDSFIVSLVEGWRGEICHVVLTDAAGKFAAYKVIDPSFHNWFGLALAMRDGEVSDFPLCNKSFNLSYCGHDL